MKQNFPYREILVFVAGATPQVITETIYALAVQNPPVIADEIHIICTGRNRELIADVLLNRGILRKLYQEYGLPMIRPENIRFIIFQNDDGSDIPDLRDIDSNEAAAQMIAQFMREKTSDPGSRLHCSLSGGRKTLSYFMGVAFQLFARQWDKLYHVLVSPEFELNSDFFYKPVKNEKIEARLRDGTVKYLNTDDAEIALIELPLIYLRNKLPLNSVSVRDLIAEGQQHIDSATIQSQLTVNLVEQSLRIDRAEIELIPTQLMIYTAFLRHKKNSCKHVQRSHCGECIDCYLHIVDFGSRTAIEEMSGDYQRMFPANPFKKEELLEKWENGLDPANVRHHISKINRAIKEQLNDTTLLPFYRIDCVRKYGKSRYGVRVERDRITIT